MRFNQRPDDAVQGACRPRVDRGETGQPPGVRPLVTDELQEADMAPEIELNEIIWKSVRGADSPMPPPRRAAFIGMSRDEEEEEEEEREKELRKRER